MFGSSGDMKKSAKLYYDQFQILEQTVKRDCWQGLQCAKCDRKWVGSINGVEVCCQNCEEKGFTITSNSCFCSQ